MADSDTSQPSKPSPNLASTSKQVQWAGGIMMASIIGSRLLAILRDTAMTAKFGLGIHTDAYRIAYTIPDLIYYGVAGGAFSSAFIPVFSEFIAKGEDEKAWELFNVIVTGVFMVVMTFVTLAFIFAHPLAAYMAAGPKAVAHPEMIGWIVEMSRILLPAQLAFFVGGIMFGVLYVKGHFVVPGLGGNIYNLGIIFGAFFLSVLVSPGIVGMTIGATLGAFIGNLVIPWLALRRIGIHYRPSFNFRADGVKKVFVLMAPVVLGLSLPGVYATIMQKFASYDEKGINTIIELSNRVMQAPLGVFGQALALAAFPVLSQFYAQNHMDHFSAQLVKTSKTVLFLSIPAAMIMIAIAPEIIQFFYAYGKAAAVDPHSLIICIRLFAIGVPAWCLHPVLMRAYFARQQSWKPMMLGTITTVVFVFLIILLRQFGLGYKSMPIAGSIGAIGLVLTLLICLQAEIKEFKLWPLIDTGSRSLVASTVVGIIAYAGSTAFPAKTHKIFVATMVIGTLIVSSLLYTFIARLLKMPEVETVDRGMEKFRAKLKRGRI